MSYIWYMQFKTTRQIASELFPERAFLKVKENTPACRIANRPIYTVWAKDADSKRGRQIASLISHQDAQGNWPAERI